MSLFTLPPDQYRRELDLRAEYVTSAATYVAKMENVPLAEARAFVERSISEGGRFEMRDPVTNVLMREANGDRKPVQMEFTRFLKENYRRETIIAPTFTTYLNPAEKKSLLGEYIIGNLAARSRAKKEMFDAEMAQDKTLRAIKNSEQNTLKIKNNSLSGAHSSQGTPLYNKSSHSTLTSTCRVATSYGNANNEKFLYGNRHYYMPHVVIENFTSIITHTDYSALENAMTTYSLVYPSVDQVMDCVVRSTESYWRSSDELSRIRAYVDRLEPRERAAVLYTGDFYHLAMCNEAFIRTFIGQLSAKVTTMPPVDERQALVKSMDPNLFAFVSMVCKNEMKSRQMNKIPVDSDDYGIIAATARNALAVLQAHEHLIRAFWVTPNLPSSVYYIPSIIRRGVITSDTDSTIFTVQFWTEWFRGQLDFTDESIAIANAMVYLSAETVRHVLALYSGNMGVVTQEIHRLSMKNEYYFPVFSLTSRAKHYFAEVMAQEGNVFPEMKTEIKGVALRNSNVPPRITAAGHAMMKMMMADIREGRMIQLRRYLRAVAKIEQAIRADILKGSSDFLQTMQIKPKESYKDWERSNYIYYEMWEEVFAPSYGHAPEPSYGAVKLNLTTDNPSRFKEWIASLPPDIKLRMGEWVKRRGREAMGTVLLPMTVVQVNGVPQEMVDVIDIRSLIGQTMQTFYLALESVGYYVQNKPLTRLVSDDTWLLAEDWPYPELSFEDN